MFNKREGENMESKKVKQFPTLEQVTRQMWTQPKLRITSIGSNKRSEAGHAMRMGQFDQSAYMVALRGP
jgi:hypothetical protein